MSISLSPSFWPQPLLRKKSMNVPSSVSIWVPPTLVLVSSKTVKSKSSPTNSVTESPPLLSHLLMKKDSSVKPLKTKLPSTQPELYMMLRDLLVEDIPTRLFNMIRNSCPMKSLIEKEDLTLKFQTSKDKTKFSPQKKSQLWS